MRYYLIIWLILFYTLPNLEAQTSEAKLFLKSKATPTSIKLRWAPDSPIAWHYANKYGYVLEKIVFLENGKVVQNKKIIFAETIFPKPLSEWESVVESNDFAAIAAQAIYGEGFEVDQNLSSTSSMVQTINKAKEMENRYSFALYAADMSVEAAQMSGLYFEDSNVDKDFKYLYRIYVNAPSEVIKLDTASVLIGLEDFHELPEISNVNATFEDQVVKLTWRGVFADSYTAYWVEKSDNGVDFDRLNKTPMVFPRPKNAVGNQLFVKLDSLEDNNKTYYYRIIGIDPFGDLGPSSEVVSGGGIPSFSYAANIKEGKVEGGHVHLDWSFPETGTSILSYFSLYRDNINTKKQDLVIEKIPKNQRHVVDSLPNSSNYYIIRATDTYGRFTTSFPFFVQLEDSIPPSAPESFEGRIDTLGYVYLSWKKPAEPDVSGYKLYRSNFVDGEFIALPGAIIVDTSYVDTLSLKSLTETVYYQVRAFDKRYNPSISSSTLELKKPDRIPPVTPLVTKIANDSLGILVNWELSPSVDAEKYLLYRQAENDIDWTLLHIIEEDIVLFYLDEEVEHGVRYAYTMVVVDDDGLESDPSIPKVIMRRSSLPYQPINEIDYLIDQKERTVKLAWTYEEKKVSKYYIYKSKNGSPFNLYKELEVAQNEIIDHFSNTSEYLEYRIMAVFSTGEKSPLSDIIKIHL